MPDSTKPLPDPMLNHHLWSSPGRPESNFTVSDQVIMLHNMFEIITFKIAATSVRGPMNWYGIKGKTSTVIVWFGYMAVLNNQWFSLAVILNCPVKCLMKPGARLTKVYEVTKDIVTHPHKLKTVKHMFCGVWVQNCVWKLGSDNQSPDYKQSLFHRHPASFSICLSHILQCVCWSVLTHF